MYSEQMYNGWVLRTSLFYFLENVLFIQLRKVSEDPKNKTRIYYSPTQSWYFEEAPQNTNNN